MLKPFFSVRTDPRVSIFVNRLGSPADTTPPKPRNMQQWYLSERLSIALLQTLYEGESERRGAPHLTSTEIGFEIFLGQHGDFGSVVGRPPVWIQITIDEDHVRPRFETAEAFGKVLAGKIAREGLFAGNFNGPPGIQLDVMLARGCSITP